MKRETLLMKAAFILLGIFALWMCLMPVVANDPEWMYLPFLIGLYATAIPFFIALYQAFKLLGYIDKNLQFSDVSIRALKVIKICAIALFVLYAAALPFLFNIAHTDDAPGLAAIGLAMAFGSAVIAVFASLLQKLIKSAMGRGSDRS